MTDEWRSLTHRFAVGGHHGYIIVATDDQDRPLLLEIRMSKAGRGYYGTFHHLSEQHLHHYVNEFSGRHDLRSLDTIHQMGAITQGMDHKRLRYKDLIA